MNIDRKNRLKWAKDLYQGQNVYPKVDIFIRNLVSVPSGHKQVDIRLETLVTVFYGKGYTVIADNYRLDVDSLDDLEGFVRQASARFRDKIHRTKDYFIADKSNTDFWFTRKEIEYV
ncbi:hypothetical protein PANI_CDS0123 [Maribacter phage Panino]